MHLGYPFVVHFEKQNETLPILPINGNEYENNNYVLFFILSFLRLQNLNLWRKKEIIELKTKITIDIVLKPEYYLKWKHDVNWIRRPA